MPIATRIVLLLLPGIILLHGQDDIEKYLLTDSLEIEALVQDPPQGPEISVKGFTQLGIVTRQMSGLSDLNQSLTARGYGSIPELNTGWLMATRGDIGERLTVGLSYGGNYFMARFQEGTQYSSRYTYYDFSIDVAFRTELAGFQVAPGIGLGISQNMLTLKPNGTREIKWDDLHANNELLTAATQVDLAISLDLSISRYMRNSKGKLRLLDVKAGMLFHPISFGDPGIPIAEINMVKITDMPNMQSSGPYIKISWGFGGKD